MLRLDVFYILPPPRDFGFVRIETNQTGVNRSYIESVYTVLDFTQI